MNEQRTPRPGEIWHPADDPDDCVNITGTNGNIVFYQAPTDADRGRSTPWNNSTNIDDFTYSFVPPKENHVNGQPMTEQDLNSGTRGEYSQWVIETRLIPSRPGIVVARNPYPKLARRDLEKLRAAHPGLKFCAVRETVTRVEEDW